MIKKPKRNYILAAAKFLVAILMLFLLTSCGNNDSQSGNSIKGISFNDKTFDYSGAAKSIYIDGNLPSNISVTYKNNGKVDVGTYIVTAEFKDKNNSRKTFNSLEATMTIKPIDVEVFFEDKEYEYDGQEKSIYIDGILPDGISVIYQNNQQRNAGTHKVTASFTNNNPNYKPIKDMTANLTISKIRYNISFENESFIYDGEEKELNIKGNLPSGITVNYSQNKMTSPGVLKVTATFSGSNSDNYETSRTAYLIVYDKNLTLTNEIKSLLKKGEINSILFGSYPQTVVDDANLIMELDKINNTNSKGYYEYQGNEYEKLKVIANQVDYKFNNGETIRMFREYYFKVEPIKWNVIKRNKGEYTLLTDLVIDREVFDTSWNEIRVIDGKNVYPNNYEHSTIREFLNNELYNKAFNNSQKNQILTSFVDNSASTTLHNSNQYISNNTNDKVYLLSYQEARNILFEEDFERSGITTDYSRSKNLYLSDNNTSYWWLRSPSVHHLHSDSNVVNPSGSVGAYTVNNRSIGVRPTINININ